MSRNAKSTDLLILLLVIKHLGLIESAILSRNKTITSSSTYYNWVPERALDGNSRRDAEPCMCCAATDSQFNPWYELDLGKHFTVERIHVEGRNDENAQHFKGMHICLQSVHKGIDTCVEIRITEDVYEVDYVLPVPKSTRYVTFVLYQETRVFTICQLTAYGECADGEFGGYCENECHCDGDPCIKTTGVCPSGKCLPGYKGAACNKACADGTYGSGCTERCGNCFGPDVCNKQNGKCPRQCARGYQGDTCKQECASGSYGLGCTLECGHCHDGEPCNRVSGICGNGCVAGYKTDSFCKIECDPGTYGVGCKDECENCKDGHAFCGKADGFCFAGCLAGYKGDTCKTECDDGTYGENCKSNCGNCLNGTACNKKTGVCVNGCNAGYIGERCVDVCDNGTFGAGCGDVCGRCYGNGSCDKVTGTCLGCERGFYGYDCKLELSNRGVADESISRDSITALAISGWVCVGILLIVGILYFMRVRMRSRQKSPTVDNKLYEIPNNSQSGQEHPYECAVVNTPDPVHVYTNTC